MEMENEKIYLLDRVTNAMKIHQSSDWESESERKKAIAAEKKTENKVWNFLKALQLK